MKKVQILTANKKELAGTGAARKTRNAGFIPGVVYGDKKAPEMFEIEPKLLQKEIEAGGFFSRVFELDIQGNKQKVLAKDVQFHPVTDKIIHIDFQRITKDAKVHVFVPIHFINEDKSPGIKKGGVLNVVLHSIEVIAAVDSIPESFEIDLAGHDINHSFHTDVLALPKNVTVAHPERDNTVASIIASKTMVEETPKAEGEKAE